jgi:hypothetical protein
VNRLALILIVLTFVLAATLAQVSTKDERDFGKPGAWKR